MASALLAENSATIYIYCGASNESILHDKQNAGSDFLGRARSLDQMGGGHTPEFFRFLGTHPVKHGGVDCAG